MASKLSNHKHFLWCNVGIHSNIAKVAGRWSAFSRSYVDWHKITDIVLVGKMPED